ncbi:hypothetical protein [Flavobacterium sp. '19STA2R22 D10 B1']|uniref:hypothetical protein n=1 Tax=Flavobacterium aerium TaxID=3037261 RepID=UPI00278C81AB|nr:hypothetical protein [Flavobacterium sp. '19STA2R22 D10 B1']
MTLDIHGVVPEEERYFKNNLLLSKYYSYVEYQVFRRINNAVCVTNSMKNHFVEKYPFYKGNYIIYSIMPDNLKEIDETQASLIKVRNEKRIEVIYSGGVQGWQNIDLMLQTIKKNQYSNIHYTILTGDKVTFENKIEEYNICSEFITVESRHPSELWKDYIAADYAFILRDENIVNNVANPTKLIEYLFYGLIPIVLSPNIGDYKELGYNYLLLNDFNENISKPDIAQKNIDIAHDLIKKNKLINMKQQVS